MQINFTGHNIEVTPALKDMVENKFHKIKHHFDHITSAHVTFNVQKLENTSEMTLHVPGHQIFAKGKSDDMYKAIDDMINSIDRQIIKIKEKQSDHRD
jgi:putative sigma-54 modulation protein